MNNIQKAFKAKAQRGLRMADGGMLTPEQYQDNSVGGLKTRLENVQQSNAASMTTMGGAAAVLDDGTSALNAERSARWRQDDLLARAGGAGSKKQGAFKTALANPVTPGVSPMPQQGQGLRQNPPAPFMSETDAINAERSSRWRQDDLLGQAGGAGSKKQGVYQTALAHPLAMAEGGIVRGPGGPTDDEVPMNVAGRDVELSNTEAVLPAKTVQALGGPKAVEHLIHMTNGKPPVKGGLRAGGEYATGAVGDTLDPRELRPEFRSQAATPVIEPAANPGLEAARNTRAAGAMGAMPEGPAYNPVQPEVAQAKPAARPSPEFTSAKAAQEARLSAQKAAEAAQGAARTSFAENLGRSAGRAYTEAGGLSGVAGKAVGAVAKHIIPAAAAYDATLGNDAIHVDDRPDDGIGQRVINGAKDIGLKAGDWGTRGADMLMDLPLWALNKAGATSDGKPLEYGLVNKSYRKGMREAGIDGAVIPTTSMEREMDPHSAARAASKSIMENGQSAGNIALPAIDKAKAQSDTAKAIASGRVGATADQGQAEEAKQAGLRAAGNIPGQNRQYAAVTQGDLAASEAMGDEADRLTGVSRSSDMGLRGMTQRFNAYTNNDAARAARNAQLQLRGDGARFEKDGNGKLWITNSGDFDGSTKMPYTDVNGNPTAIHTGSQQHRQGLRDAANQKSQLATMQQNRLERNAGDDITDEGLRTRSRQALDTQGRQAAELAKAQIARAPTALDLDKHQLAKDQFALDQQKAGNAQENAMRNFKASQSAQVTKLIDSALDTQAPTTGLKDDELKKAQAKRADLETALYAAHKRMPGDDAEYAASMPGMMRQAKLSVAMRDAIQNRGLWNKITNLGRDPWQTLNAAAPKLEGDSLVFPNNFSIPLKEVIGKDADLLAAYKERLKSQ